MEKTSNFFFFFNCSSWYTLAHIKVDQVTNKQQPRGPFNTNVNVSLSLLGPYENAQAKVAPWPELPNEPHIALLAEKKIRANVCTACTD